MNSGKAFSSLDGIACSYQCSDQFVSTKTLTSQVGIGFLETIKNPANSFKNNLNKTRNDMKSQIQKKKKRERMVELWQYYYSTYIFPKKASHKAFS